MKELSKSEVLYGKVNMPVDLWCETASPVKNGLKEAFFEYAAKIYEEKNIVLSSYFPSAMGGDMPATDYLFNMNPEELPENLLTMSFCEISTDRFINRYIKTGVYKSIESTAYFPLVMVCDKTRLETKKLPVPENYIDLCNSCYKNEICIIGVPGLPDPTVALHIYRTLGKKAAMDFSMNIAGFGAPVNVIRHIGKSSNNFGSIFVIPLLFAKVCQEKKSAKIITPESGFIAENFVLLSKDPESEKSKIIHGFFSTPLFVNVMEKKCFPVRIDSSMARINSQLQCYYTELAEVYKILHSNPKLQFFTIG